jgi:hypothetical protein
MCGNQSEPRLRCRIRYRPEGWFGVTGMADRALVWAFSVCRADRGGIDLAGGGALLKQAFCCNPYEMPASLSLK